MYGPPGRSHDVADDAKGPVFVKLRKGSPKRNTRQIELIGQKIPPFFRGFFVPNKDSPGSITMHLWLLAAAPALRLAPPMMKMASYEPYGVARGSEMNGCGGASPFAPFNGGGSGSDQTKWAPGGQWTDRTQGVIVPTGPAPAAALPAPSEPAPESVGVMADEPYGVTPGTEMHGCGGASPFAPFNGGGSGSDQTKWAPGGQWTESNM